MKLSILGCYAATPRKETNTSSQVLEIGGGVFLIDCGEGTQKQLRKMGVKFSKIGHIFISHLHGDHVFGLPGFISSLALLGRKEALYIYGPSGLKRMLHTIIELSGIYIDFPLIINEIEASDNAVVIFESKTLTVSTILLRHRISTYGYLFKEQEREKTLDIERVKALGIHYSNYANIKRGMDYITETGKTIKNAELVLIQKGIAQSYAYCSDTQYFSELAEYVRGVNVLYHESTFTDQHIHMTKKTCHSTASQAAKVAKDAGVEHLVLGHFSTRYSSTNIFWEEASKVFNPVHLAEDGKVFVF